MPRLFHVRRHREVDLQGVIDRLLAEHGNLGMIVRLLERQPPLIAAPQAPNISLLVDAIYYLTRFPDLAHHALEDRIAERLRTIGALGDEHIDEIEAQHATLARQGSSLLENLESAVRDEGMPRDLLAANVRLYGERLRHNMAVEELTLFPAATRSLGEADWRVITTGATDPGPDPVFKGPAQTRFEQLRQAIFQESRHD